jgi:hypothetical protein
MYRIIKHTFGFELVFGDTLSADEMKQWRQEAVRSLVGAPKSFGILVDMHTLRRSELDAETQEALAEGLDLFKRSGTLRSCIILDSAPITAQYRRRARESRVYYFERYINAAVEPLWRRKAVGWLENQVEPDA